MFAVHVLESFLFRCQKNAKLRIIGQHISGFRPFEKRRKNTKAGVCEVDALAYDDIIMITLRCIIHCRSAFVIMHDVELTALIY